MDYYKVYNLGTNSIRYILQKIKDTYFVKARIHSDGQPFAYSLNHTYIEDDRKDLIKLEQHELVTCILQGFLDITRS